MISSLSDVKNYYIVEDYVLFTPLKHRKMSVKTLKIRQLIVKYVSLNKLLQSYVAFLSFGLIKFFLVLGYSHELYFSTECFFDQQILHSIIFILRLANQLRSRKWIF